MSLQEQSPVDLQSLTDRYELIAELRTGDATQMWIGKRRDDGSDVLIVVSRTPEGDEKNALTLLAADAHLLATLPHRNLVPIIDVRWIGTDALAVISARVADPTLDELIARGEEFSSPRIAAILQEVYGLLEWARSQKVVHRALGPSNIFLEPGTDRVRAIFAIRPITVFGAPDADAKTIATLAWMMFAKQRAVPAESPPLSELCPFLSERVANETDALLRAPAGEMPAVEEFIALVAMGDALKAAKKETVRVRTALLEEQRLAKEQFDLERKELEQKAADQERRNTEQREDFERLIANEREELAKQRAELERAVAEEREQLIRSFAEERDQLTQSLTEEREELQSTIAGEREQLAVERQTLEEIGAAAVRQREEADQRLRELEEARRLAGSAIKRARLVPLQRMRSALPSGRSRWAIPGVAAALVLIVASALAIGHYGPSASRFTARANATPPIVDSAAGRIAPAAPLSAPPAAAARPQSAAQVDSAAKINDSTAAPRPKRRRVVVEPPAPADSSLPPDSLALDSTRRLLYARRDSAVRDSIRRRDSMRRRDSGVVAPAPAPASGLVPRRPPVGTDSAARRGSSARPRPDSVRRPDSAAANPASVRVP